MKHTFEETKREWNSGFIGYKNPPKTLGGYVINNLRKLPEAIDSGRWNEPFMYEGEIFDEHELHRKRITLKWDTKGRCPNFIFRSDCNVDPVIFEKLK